MNVASVQGFAFFSGLSPSDGETIISDRLDTMFVLIKQMEATMRGLKRLRRYLSDDVGIEMLERLIRDTETTLEPAKRKLIQ